MATTKATTLAHTLGGISSDISTAEINRLDGLTGDIQTLLNLKAPLASPTLTGTPNLGSNPTVTLHATGDSNSTNTTFPKGHVIQTVYKQGAEGSNTTSNSFDNRVTGMDTTITPRFASSSILITASFGHYSSGDYSIYDIYKNASDVTATYNLSGKSFGIAQASGQSKWMHTTMTYEDPLAENSITQKTYSLSFKCHSSGTTYLGWGSTSIIVLTLQEIAG